jgi:hypothetical protein
MDEDESGMVSDKRKSKCLVKPVEMPLCPAEIPHTGEGRGLGSGISWTAEYLLSPQEGLYSVE